MPKIENLRSQLHQLLDSGAYGAGALPPERELAEDLGVSRVTLRRALGPLLEEGKLRRAANGRLWTRESGPRVVFLGPPSASTAIENLAVATAHGARGRKIVCHRAHYHDQNDPVIAESLRDYDGVFFAPGLSRLSSELKTLFAKYPKSLFTYEEDLSGLGLASLLPMPASQVPSLLDLFGPSVKRVDCLTDLPEGSLFDDRVESWRLWSQMTGRKGHLLRREVTGAQLGDIPKWVGAHENHHGRARAWFCTSERLAMAAARGFLDAGRKFPRDVAMVAMGDLGFAPFLNPRLTCLKPADPGPWVDLCLWSLSEKGFILPRKMEPLKPIIFRGETV